MTHFSRHQIINNLRDKRKELEDKLEVIENLVVKWRGEIKEYPDTEIGQHSKIAVGLCSNELENVLENSEFTTNSEESE